MLVTGAADVVEIAGPLELREVVDPGELDRPRLDFDGPHDRAAFDAIGVRVKDVDDVARVAGLTHAEVRAALGRMELSGLVQQEAGRWRRVVSSQQH